MTPEERAALWAALPPITWLAGVTGPARHDTVVAWAHAPDGMMTLPCGIRWDALRTPAELGLVVLKVLRNTDARHALGPVLHDRRADLLYWLLPVEASAAAEWQAVDPALRLLSHGSFLALPDPEPEFLKATPAARWVHWPTVTGTLTPPDMLAAAITQHLALEDA